MFPAQQEQEPVSMPRWKSSLGKRGRSGCPGTLAIRVPPAAAKSGQVSPRRP